LGIAIANTTLPTGLSHGKSPITGKSRAFLNALEEHISRV